MFSPSVVSRAVRRVILFISIICFHLPSFAQSFLERGSILVSHFSADYASSNDEFVVLYNTLPDTSFLDGYELRYFTSSGSSGSILRSFPVGSAIPPFSHFLVASKETVAVGGAVAIRDQSLSPGMAATGGQVVLRNSSEIDSVVFALAWGTVSTFVAGMTDAASWGGDGMISLSFVDGAYVRSSFNSSNAQYTHTSSSSITSIPSLHPYVPLVGSQWQLRIVAQQGESRDSSVVVGMVDEATAWFDVSLDVPKPPPPAGGGVSVSSWRPEYLLATGPHLMVDYISVEPLAENAFSWRLSVTPSEPGSALFISCKPESLSPAIPVILIDEENGLRHSFSPQDSVYSFVPAGVSPRFLRLSVGDTTAPSITIDRPTANERLVAGRVEPLRWEVTDASGIDTIGLSVQTALSSEFVPLSSPTITDTGYTWQIPTTLLSESVRVRIFARDSMGNANTATSSIFSVVHDTVEHFFTTGWHLMGIPVLPAESSVASLFELAEADSLYLFRFEPVHGYTLAETVVPGEGYFLGSLQPRTLRVPGVEPEDTTQYPLRKGFNIIARHANAPKAKGEMSLVRNGQRFSYNEALSEGMIAAGLSAFDAETQVYTFTDTMEAWRGYWLPVLEDSISLEWDAQPFPQLRTITPSRSGWRMRFFVSSENVTDSSALLGIDALSTDGFDPQFDAPAPPAPPSEIAVQAFFKHPSWNTPVGSTFVGDIRPPNGERLWNLSIRTRGAGEVILRWEVEGILDGLLLLADKEEGGEVDMRSRSWIVFPSGNERSFVISSAVMGIADQEEDIPHAFRLHNAYPNPFNAEVTIPFDVPKRSYIRITVSDILGRQVATLVDGTMEAGSHKETWHPQQSTGVYIVRMEPAGGRKAIVLVR